jgi:hypothetical protein
MEDAMKWRKGIGFTALAGAGMMVLPLAVAGPAGAVSETQVVASGLNSPGKLAFGPDGALYVSEAGTGGEANADHSNCIPAGDEGGEQCYGDTGSITKVDGDAQTRVVTGLPSLGGAEGAAGPADVAVADDGTIYTVIGLGTDPNARDQAGDPFTNLGTVFKKGPTAMAPTKFADIAAFERDHDPDADAPRDPQDTDPTTDSNPYALTMASDGRLYVADAGGNDVVAVDGTGAVSVVSVLPYGDADAPDFLGAPPGTKIKMQPVPTSVEIIPSNLPGPLADDQVLIGQLTGFPFPVGGANIYSLNGNADPQDNLDVAFAGLTNVIDVAVAPDGTLYALEIASNGLLSDTPQAALIQLRGDGTRKVILNSFDLVFPGGVAVDGDGMVYVSDTATGNVIKVDPTVARDPATASACNPAIVLGTSFDDITQDFHHEAIECLAFWGLAQGKTETTFDPHAQVTRGQAASTVARLMEAAGFTFSDNPPNAFADDDTSVHAHRIDQLAQAGVISGFADGTFRPQDPVNRSQIASLLVRAYEAVSGTTISGPDAFGDDEGSVHEDDINAAAGQGWVNGVGQGNFNPTGVTARDQLSSIVARVLSTLVDDGKATPPAAG